MDEGDDELEAVLRTASGVVFLCTGNMVRSAFAELYARHRGIALPVRSAATTFRNDGLFPETAVALRARGVDEDVLAGFRSTHVGDCLSSLDPGVVVFGMTRRHLEALAPRPELAGRSFLLARLLGHDEEIADPVLEGADFGRTFDRVARCVDALLSRPELSR